MRKKKLVDQLGAEETGEIYTYQVTAIVFSRTTGTRVWKKDFRIFLPAREALQPGSEETKAQKLKAELTRWVRTFNRRRPRRQIRFQVTDERGSRLPAMESILERTS